ncbi:MAG: glycogen debranching enzyme family protein [Bacteroidales bacterium]|nr:glycogen debranching enzyme family protein [Bacteroidales bacterium]
MEYIQFDKEKLINLSYSLDKEFLRSNRRGSYASSTLIFCNTRKYHGLLVAPQPAIDDELHVMLSSVDATIIQHNSEFNLGLHQYPGGVFIPKGHKYVRELHSDPIPRIVYRVGGVVFSEEIIFSRDADRVLIKYTLEDCHSPTTIRLKPYLAFRQRHQLSKANEWTDKKFKDIPNGVSFKMYQGYLNLMMQFSKKVDYIHVPDWYYNIEYVEEQRRGYDFQEDLFVPGYFEFPMKKGESIILSAGLDEIKPVSLKKMFDKEVAGRIPRNSFDNCLKNAAQQFIRIQDDKKVYVVAGYPWFGYWGRDTFISLPGLSLAFDDDKLYGKVLDTMITTMKGPLFFNVHNQQVTNYSSVDAPLWFVWAVQQFYLKSNDIKTLKKTWYNAIKSVIEGFVEGTDFNIHKAENGLLFAGNAGLALTWMDAVVAGKPVTPRTGFTVEVNALWYNAVNFALELAKIYNDSEWIEKLQSLPELIANSFKETFWDKDHGYLADFVDGDYKDWSIRPNMVIATSLPYSPISLKIRQLILKTAAENLLTERGLRTLSPRNSNYKGVCEGNQTERDLAYHQGTVWPWLFGHFVEGYLKVHGKSGVRKMQWYMEKIEETMKEHGIGTISEIYDGDPPHTPRGCISQAWSVAEILRANHLINHNLKEI